MLAIHIRQDPKKPTDVDELIVGTGRPLGLFPTADKRHTTAWQVTVDTVRAAVVKQPIPIAVANVFALIRDALRLPGAGLRDTLALSTRTRFDTAKTEAENVIALTTTDLPTLRRAIAAFLTLRNVTALSAVDTGPYSPGSGESAPAKRLRAADTGTKPSRTVMRNDIWALFDFVTIKTMLAAATTGAELGAASKPDAKTKVVWAASAVAQHLDSIKMAYPTAFARASTGGHNWADDFHTRAIAEGIALANANAVKAKLGPLLAWTATAIAHRTPNPASDPDFSVQVSTKANGDVDKLTASGRPATILSTGQGSHLIAFVLHVEVLRKLATGTLAAAIRAVRTSLKSLIDKIEENDEPKRALPSGSRHRYDAARTAALTAITRSKNAALDEQSRLEDICIAWLMYVNASPLSAVKEGLALNKAEGTTIGVLRTMQEYRAGSAAPSSWQHAWGLLDHEALSNVVTRDPTERLRLNAGDSPVQDYPGVTQEPAEDGAFIILTYLDEMRLAFPDVVTDTELDGEDALAYLLASIMGLSREFIAAIAAEVDPTFDMTAAVAAAPVAPAKVRKRRKQGDDDEDEYEDQPTKRARKAPASKPKPKRKAAAPPGRKPKPGAKSKKLTAAAIAKQAMGPKKVRKTGGIKKRNTRGRGHH